MVLHLLARVRDLGGLDSRDLTITRVTDERGAALPFQLGAVNPILGQPLTITLPAAPADVVVVEYETSPASAA